MKKVIFMGTPDFAVPILDALMKSTYDVVLVVTQPDRPKGRKRTLTAPPVKKAAITYGLPVFQPEKLAADYETLFQYEADLIITAAYGQLLPKELLQHPPFGCINVHASLLPELRGGAPIHYAILEGKKETGITIMYMAEKLDAGDLLTQQKIPIERTDHVGILHDKLSEVGASLLMETIPKLFSAELTPEKQNENEATFAPNITREQEKIDWHRSHEEIYNQIRGLHPWPVAYTTYDGERMKIWWGTMDETIYNDRNPGEIGKVNDDNVIIVCGNSKGIAVTDMQLAGRRRMKMDEFLRGNPELFQAGQMLG